MSDTTKKLSDLDANQTLQMSYNEVDATFTTTGFLTGKVGRKITPVISTTDVADDTITYTYSENTINLYSIQCIYTDGTRTNLISAERIS